MEDENQDQSGQPETLNHLARRLLSRAGPAMSFTGLPSGGLVGRISRQIEHAQVWVPDIGHVSPLMVDNFTSSIRQRFPSIGRKYAIEARSLEENEAEDLVLPPISPVFTPVSRKTVPGRSTTPTRLPPELQFGHSAAQASEAPSEPSGLTISTPPTVQRKPGVRPVSAVEMISTGPGTQFEPDHAHPSSPLLPTRPQPAEVQRFEDSGEEVEDRKDAAGPQRPIAEEHPSQQTGSYTPFEVLSDRPAEAAPATQRNSYTQENRGTSAIPPALPLLDHAPLQREMLHSKAGSGADLSSSQMLSAETDPGEPLAMQKVSPGDSGPVPTLQKETDREEPFTHTVLPSEPAASQNPLQASESNTNAQVNRLAENNPASLIPLENQPPLPQTFKNQSEDNSRAIGLTTNANPGQGIPVSRVRSSEPANQSPIPLDLRKPVSSPNMQTDAQTGRDVEQPFLSEPQAHSGALTNPSVRQPASETEKTAPQSSRPSLPTPAVQLTRETGRSSLPFPNDDRPTLSGPDQPDGLEIAPATNSEQLPPPPALDLRPPTSLSESIDRGLPLQRETLADRTLPIDRGGPQENGATDLDPGGAPVSPSNLGLLPDATNTQKFTSFPLAGRPDFDHESSAESVARVNTPDTPQINRQEIPEGRIERLTVRPAPPRLPGADNPQAAESLFRTPTPNPPEASQPLAQADHIQHRDPSSPEAQDRQATAKEIQRLEARSAEVSKPQMPTRPLQPTMDVSPSAEASEPGVTRGAPIPPIHPARQITDQPSPARSQDLPLAIQRQEISASHSGEDFQLSEYPQANRSGTIGSAARLLAKSKANQYSYRETQLPALPSAAILPQVKTPISPSNDEANRQPSSAPLAARPTLPLATINAQGSAARNSARATAQQAVATVKSSVIQRAVPGEDFFSSLPDAQISSAAQAEAPIQRALTSQIAGAEPLDQPKEEPPDLDDLARKIYPIIKQMLAVERERFSSR